MEKSEFKKKWENYWYHYKARTWVIVFVIALLGYTVFEVISTSKSDITLTYIGKFADYAGIESEIEESFKNDIEDIDKDGKIKAYVTEILATSEHFEGDMMFWQRIDVSLLNGESYIYLVDQTVYDYLKERNSLGKLVINGEEKDYIDVTENKYFKKYIFDDEKLFLCVRKEFSQTPSDKVILNENNSKKIIEIICKN